MARGRRREVPAGREGSLRLFFNARDFSFPPFAWVFRGFLPANCVVSSVTTTFTFLCWTYCPASPFPGPLFQPGPYAVRDTERPPSLTRASCPNATGTVLSLPCPLSLLSPRAQPRVNSCVSLKDTEFQKSSQHGEVGRFHTKKYEFLLFLRTRQSGEETGWR